jgi:hypothetical protein
VKWNGGQPSGAKTWLTNRTGFGEQSPRYGPDPGAPVHGAALNTLKVSAPGASRTFVTDTGKPGPPG